MAFRRIQQLAAGSAIALVSASALAQFPDKPVTLIIPFAPGGTNDVVGRIVANELSQSFGKQVIPDNRAGGGGVVGWSAAAKAPADGYTLLTSDMSFAIAAGLFPKLPFDPKKDFVPVSTVASVPFVMAVNMQVPAKSVAEFITLAKNQSGKLNYGSAGNGTNSHLAAELFKLKTSVNMTHVPYKGASAALQDLMGGRIDVIFTALPTALPHIRSGRLRPLMVTSAERIPLLPDVPSAKEAGLSDMQMDFWAGVAAPAGTPPAIVQRLNAEISTAMARPSARQALADQGLSVVADTPAQAAKFMGAEIDRWAALIRTANIKPD